MIQKFKVTYCAFILCLFGLTLMTVSPVFAQESEYDKCFSMGKKKGKGSKYPYKPRMNCFQELASDLIEDARARQEELDGMSIIISKSNTKQQSNTGGRNRMIPIIDVEAYLDAEYQRSGGNQSAGNNSLRACIIRARGEGWYECGTQAAACAGKHCAPSLLAP